MIGSTVIQLQFSFSHYNSLSTVMAKTTELPDISILMICETAPSSFSTITLYSPTSAGEKSWINRTSSPAADRLLANLSPISILPDNVHRATTIHSLKYTTLHVNLWSVLYNADHITGIKLKQKWRWNCFISVLFQRLAHLKQILLAGLTLYLTKCSDGVTTSSHSSHWTLAEMGICTWAFGYCHLLIRRSCSKCFSTRFWYQIHACVTVTAILTFCQLWQ